MTPNTSVTRKCCSSHASSQRIPRHLVLEQHGMRRLHPQEFVRRMSCRQRHGHVPGGLRAHDEGTDGVGSICYEDQVVCSNEQHHHCWHQTLLLRGRLFQPCFEQQNPRRLLQSDMGCDDFIRKNMCVDAPCRSTELTAASPSAMKINVLTEVQRAPPVDAPIASVCGSVRGGSHTARTFPGAENSRRDRCCVALTWVPGGSRKLLCWSSHARPVHCPILCWSVWRQFHGCKDAPLQSHSWPTTRKVGSVGRQVVP